MSKNGLPDLRSMTGVEAMELFLGEVERLRKAEKLLQEVHSETGPYGQHPIPDELRYKINDFFGFDDSE